MLFSPEPPGDHQMDAAWAAARERERRVLEDDLDSEGLAQVLCSESGHVY